MDQHQNLITKSQERFDDKKQPVAREGDNFIFIGWGGLGDVAVNVRKQK